MDFLQPVLVVGIVFFSIVTIVRIATETKTRNRLIDKGLVDENVRYLYPDNARLRALSNVKWGMVLVGIGAAWLVSRLFPYRISDEIAFGLMFLLAGIGFLIYVPIAKHEIDRDKRDQGKPPSVS